ncbi:MAG: cytidine deaminase, partial [Oscillospiraceae bacterium]
SPYSHYMVGAAVLGTDGKIYKGTNIENASFGATVCAERTAIFGMINGGCRKFAALAVVGGTNGGNYPCCLCRQVMTEFCDSLNVAVYSSGPDKIIYEATLSEIVPSPFMSFVPNDDYFAK